MTSSSAKIYLGTQHDRVVSTIENQIDVNAIENYLKKSTNRVRYDSE